MSEIAPDLQRKIDRAIDASHGEMSRETLNAAVANNHVAMFRVGNSILATRIMTYDTGLKTLLVELAAGDLAEVLDAEELMMEIAKHNGCTRLDMVGRKGWERPLREAGWKFRHVSMMKEVAS